MKHEKVGFSTDELARYNRHIIIPGFGLEAQEKLKAAKVLVIGAGGLGSPALLYLAAAGVGTIGIVDHDVVEDSNLHRQVLYGVEDIGHSKAQTARKKLQSLNPHIRVQIYNMQFSRSNALSLISDYDVVADGTDNFPTRYLVNDACVLLGKTNVYASIFQFEGQLTVFNHLGPDGDRGPNYRDLFSAPPAQGIIPSCAEGGVLGVLPGIMGCMQALEVIKVITGVGDVLSGRLFLYDALSFESRTFRFNRNPANPLNNASTSMIELTDYEQFCGVSANEKEIKEITPAELYDLQVRGDDFQLIDVREPDEYEKVNIGGQLIPLGNVLANAALVSRTKNVIVHCKMGGRSAKAIRQLEDQFGFKNLYNLKGGIVGYLQRISPELVSKC